MQRLQSAVFGLLLLASCPEAGWMVNAADAANEIVWMEDALPTGAGGVATGGDSWTWVSASPAPFSGAKAHQSSTGAGLHEHFFNWASATLTVGAGETLYTYVYLDPANLPRELMLCWNSDNWEHRAYWGANLINYGKDGTPSRRYMGPLPVGGQWVRLEVPANLIALECQTLTGMGIALYDGRATCDRAGKSNRSAAPTGTNPPISTNAPPPEANPAPAGTNSAPGDVGDFPPLALP